MQIIILAAGKGSRMNSSLPKVMHKVDGIPMLERVILNCAQVSNDLVLVYSKHLDPYLHMFSNHCKLVNQTEQLGTAHAVFVAKNLFNNEGNIGVIYGDNPLITPDIIRGLFDHLDKTNSQVVTLAFEYEKTNQYGRIILDSAGNFQKIVELRFASPEEQKVTLCNSGIMAFAPGILAKYIDRCIVSEPNNIGKELFLTNIIEICALAGEKVSYYKSTDHELVIGVNTQSELESANSIIKQK